VTHVLRQQDPVGVAAPEELQQQLDDAAFTVTLEGAE
jgi:hypothetical protein